MESDEAAFDALYARTREPVLHHVERIVVDRAAAEDVVQEAFLRVWSKSGQWEHRGPARSWVFRIATNLSLNLLESRRRAGRMGRARSEDEEESEDLLVRVADAAETRPEAILERDDRIRIVREAVAELSEGKRSVMDIFLNETPTLREIAQRLGLPLGTVKSRFHYASRELRELLGNQE